MREYKLYGTITYSGYVVVRADNEMVARQKGQRGSFDKVEIPTLRNRHFDFIWDHEDPEEIVNPQ